VPSPAAAERAERGWLAARIRERRSRGARQRDDVIEHDADHDGGRSILEAGGRRWC
jgi:hypothetical protein